MNLEGDRNDRSRYFTEAQIKKKTLLTPAEFYLISGVSISTLFEPHSSKLLSGLTDKERKTLEILSKNSSNIIDAAVELGIKQDTVKKRLFKAAWKMHHATKTK